MISKDVQSIKQADHLIEINRFSTYRCIPGPLSSSPSLWRQAAAITPVEACGIEKRQKSIRILFFITIFLYSYSPGRCPHLHGYQRFAVSIRNNGTESLYIQAREQIYGWQGRAGQALSRQRHVTGVFCARPAVAYQRSAFSFPMGRSYGPPGPVLWHAQHSISRRAGPPRDCSRCSTNIRP